MCLLAFCVYLHSFIFVCFFLSQIIVAFVPMPLPSASPPPPSQLCSAQTGQSARTSTKWSGSVSSRSASHGTARPLFPHQLAQDMASLFPAAPPAPKEACRVSPDGKRLHLHFHFTDICIFFFAIVCSYHTRRNSWICTTSTSRFNQLPNQNFIISSLGAAKQRCPNCHHHRL